MKKRQRNYGLKLTGQKKDRQKNRQKDKQKNRQKDGKKMEKRTKQ
jgi:hypothetical protein